jgi:alpha-methylacyl-CoA racemase
VTPTPTGPLRGVRVVELAGIGPGPFAAMILAELGADVIRIDRPGDGGMALPPRFDLLRRGRPSVEVDLRTADGLGQVLELVSKAHVLIEGSRPGVAERLGLGAEDCWTRNPGLVYGRMTGWGQDGPLAHTAGHDITYLAVSGALHPIGRAGGGPVMPVNLLGDFAGGSMYLVTGLLAALWEARTSGRGQVVDAAIVDGAASLTTLLHGMIAAGAWSTERGTNMLDGGVPWYDVYRTSDDQWMAVGALEPKFFAEFCRLLPLQASETERADPQTWPAMRRTIADAFGTRTRSEWTELFADTDACVAPVLSLTEARDHPHLQHRRTFLTIDGISQPAPAPRFSRTPTAVGHPAGEPALTVEQVVAAWR